MFRRWGFLDHSQKGLPYINTHKQSLQGSRVQSVKIEANVFPQPQSWIHRGDKVRNTPMQGRTQDPDYPENTNGYLSIAGLLLAIQVKRTRDRGQDGGGALILLLVNTSILPAIFTHCMLIRPMGLTVDRGRHIHAHCTYQPLFDLILSIDQGIDCLNANIVIHDNVRVITVTPEERRKLAFILWLLG